MSKIKISLTDFVDFVSKSGTTKLTKVTQIKNRPPYQPAFDFWKQMRDKIIQFHKSNSTSKNDLDKVITVLRDKKKIGRYPDIIAGYKKFLGRKKITYFKTDNTLWAYSDMEVIINPEIGLNINGNKHIIKLYFKSEKLSFAKVEIILYLLKESYQKEIASGTTVAILDIQNHKLITSKNKKKLMPLLKGEAQSFETIWKAI